MASLYIASGSSARGHKKKTRPLLFHSTLLLRSYAPPPLCYSVGIVFFCAAFPPPPLICVRGEKGGGGGSLTVKVAPHPAALPPAAPLCCSARQPSPIKVRTNLHDCTPIIKGCHVVRERQ